MTAPEYQETSREHNIELLIRLEGIYARGAMLTPADMAALVVAAELGSVSADAGFVATLSEDGATVEVSRVTQYSEAPVHLAFPIDAPYPLAEMFRRETDMFVESNEQLACDHPGLVRVDAADHACATIPLRDAEGRLLGALNLGFENPHVFGETERDVIQALGVRCADALQQALSARGAAAP